MTAEILEVYGFFFKDCFSHSTRYYGKTIFPRQIKNGVNVSMYVYEVVVLASSD